MSVAALVAAAPALAKQSEGEKQEIRAGCARYDGTLQVFTTGEDKGDIYCEVPALDEQCEQEYPDWEDFPPFFDVATGECIEGCFLTTACVGLIGLEDDCFELRVLRRFRDERLARMPGGAEEIASYYHIAPRILRRMETSPAARGELSRVYATMILPSVTAALLGQDRLARWIYKRGIDRLSRKYLA